MPATSTAVRELAHRHRLAYALGIHPMCTAAAGEADLAALRARARGAPRRPAPGGGRRDRPRPLRRRPRPRAPGRALRGPARARPRVRPAGAAARPPGGRQRPQAAAPRPVRGGIAHAFNGSEQQAGAFIDLGFRLGFGGALTFDRALRIRRVAAAVPLEAIVMETDAPDIAPHWLYRTAEARAAGATMRNVSAELPRIGAELAGLRGDRERGPGGGDHRQCVRGAASPRRMHRGARDMSVPARAEAARGEHHGRRRRPLHALRDALDPGRDAGRGTGRDRARLRAADDGLDAVPRRSRGDAAAMRCSSASAPPRSRASATSG